MKIVFKPSYGMIKHSETNENLALILSLLVAENSTLLFSFYERNMHLCDASKQKFIIDRCVFVNSEWVLPWAETIPHWDESNMPPKIIWFSATEKEDILQAIEIDNLFRCVVIERGGEFKQYSNVLFHQEYYSSTDEEDYDYYLGFTNKQDFLDNALPNIKERFKVSVTE
ncbi:hypothetical protein [Paenibacillus faecis]|nr:hypothetical protein [Paenibacillus faecis]